MQMMSGRLQAYRLACHYGDTEEEVHETMKISSSAVFNKLMLFVLKEADSIFLRMLSLDEQSSVTARDVQRAKRLKKVESLLKSFLGNSLHLLGKLCHSPSQQGLPEDQWPCVSAYSSCRAQATWLSHLPYNACTARYNYSCRKLSLLKMWSTYTCC